LQTIYQKKQEELENINDQEMTDYDDDEQEYP